MILFDWVFCMDTGQPQSIHIWCPQADWHLKYAFHIRYSPFAVVVGRDVSSAAHPSDLRTESSLCCNINMKHCPLNFCVKIMIFEFSSQTECTWCTKNYACLLTGLHAPAPIGSNNSWPWQLYTRRAYNIKSIRGQPYWLTITFSNLISCPGLMYTTM